ncbi:MAG: nucleotidyl transferase AbiEii/AbiGii toxin family protein [Calditrichaeota bacterium]|nr:nucleotidyl transferase AbiEii/AbiGii toxin family protein [Calditrichota bacterium]
MYGLDRFSEDLGFSLLHRDDGFSLSAYCSAVENELKSFGFSVSVETKVKKIETNIDSAFIKADTLKNLIIIDLPGYLTKKIQSGKLVKVKLEVDKDPPGGFETEAKYLFQPIPFSVNTFTLPDLFAGKMHAVLCRIWGIRVKGRDWYDLAWYAGQDIALSLNHLENRMKQTKHLNPNDRLTEHSLKRKLLQRIHQTDWNSAKKDVENLIKDPASLELWSDEFFNVICERIKVI